MRAKSAARYVGKHGNYSLRHIGAFVCAALVLFPRAEALAAACCDAAYIHANFPQCAVTNTVCSATFTCTCDSTCPSTTCTYDLTGHANGLHVQTQRSFIATGDQSIHIKAKSMAEIGVPSGRVIFEASGAGTVLVPTITLEIVSTDPAPECHPGE